MERTGKYVEIENREREKYIEGIEREKHANAPWTRKRRPKRFVTPLDYWTLPSFRLFSSAFLFIIAFCSSSSSFFFSFRISQVRIAGSHLIIFYQWKWDSPLFRRFAALHVNICNHETKQGAKFGIRRPRFRTLRPCWNTDTLVSNCLDVISIWCSWIVDSWPVMRQTSTFAIFLSAHLYMRSVYLPQQGETYFVIPFSNSDFSVIK